MLGVVGRAQQQAKSKCVCWVHKLSFRKKKHTLNITAAIENETQTPTPCAKEEIKFPAVECGWVQFGTSNVCVCCFFFSSFLTHFHPGSLRIIFHQDLFGQLEKLQPLKPESEILICTKPAKRLMCGICEIEQSYSWVVFGWHEKCSENVKESALLNVRDAKQRKMWNTSFPPDKTLTSFGEVWAREEICNASNEPNFPRQCGANVDCSR